MITTILFWLFIIFWICVLSVALPWIIGAALVTLIQAGKEKRRLRRMERENAKERAKMVKSLFK